MYMRNGQVFTITTRPAHQRRVGLAQARLFGRRGRSRFGTALSGFQAAGTPLPRTSAASQAQAARTRRKDCLYGQAAGEFDNPPETLGRVYWEVSERLGDASTGSLSEKREAWLRSVRKDASSYATILIGYSVRRFCRFTGCWRRKEFRR